MTDEPLPPVGISANPPGIPHNRPAHHSALVSHPTHQNAHGLHYVRGMGIPALRPPVTPSTAPYSPSLGNSAHITAQVPVPL